MTAAHTVDAGRIAADRKAVADHMAVARTVVGGHMAAARMVVVDQMAAGYKVLAGQKVAADRMAPLSVADHKATFAVVERMVVTYLQNPVD